MPEFWPFKRPPYEVQREALRRSEKRDKFGFFMEQGLGKTTTDYADYLRLLLMSNWVQGHIILMPSYLKGNWYDEAKEIGFLDKVPIFKVWPDKDCRDLWTIGEKPFCLAMNFEAILHSGGELVELLMSRFHCMMTVDEPSPMRNHGTQTAKRIMNLAQYTNYRRLTYGTPDPESAKDWYLQLRFLGEVEGWNPYAFRNRYCVMGGYMAKQAVGRKNEAELAKRVSNVGFRALKKDWWGDAPEKIPVYREFEMTGDQLKHYKRMEDEFFTFIGDNEERLEIYTEQVINMLQKLQQIARGFIIDNAGQVQDLMPLAQNPAIKVTKAILLETAGKVIVFTIHKHALEQLAEAFKDAKPAILRGGMTREEIDAEKYRFNNDPACRYIFGMEQVMARGHTLLGQDGDDRCSTTLFYENAYYGELRSHAEDRNHRFGQDRAVVYIDLVASANDKKVVKALQKKQKLMLALADMVKSARQEVVNAS